MQITTGKTTRTLGPVMLTILAAAPEAAAIVEGRGKKRVWTKLEVQGMPLEIGACLSEVSVDLTIARGLTVQYITDDDDFTGDLCLVYMGKNGDLADDLVEIAQRGCTLADVIAKTPRGTMPALLEPFAGLRVTLQQDDRDDDYVVLKLDDSTAALPLAA